MSLTLMFSKVNKKRKNKNSERLTRMILKNK